MTALTLYTYWRSSAAYRVRIALHLKGLEAEQVSIHLVKDGGEQYSEAYLTVNPHGLIPALVHHTEAGDITLSNSLAIIEYLDEVFPEPPLLPADAAIIDAAISGKEVPNATSVAPITKCEILK